MQKIAKKLIEIMKECRFISKSGVNQSQNYKYTTTADVMEKVNTALTNHGIASIVNPEIIEFKEVTTSKGNIANLATVKVTINLIDAESGETCTISGIGSGQDFNDKAIMKAQSAAIKYAYLLSFAIATGDDDSDRRDRNDRNDNSRKFYCEDCGAIIDQKTANFSNHKFGRPLCRNCQQEN